MTLDQFTTVVDHPDHFSLMLIQCVGTMVAIQSLRKSNDSIGRHYHVVTDGSLVRFVQLGTFVLDQ